MPQAENSVACSVINAIEAGPTGAVFANALIIGLSTGNAQALAGEDRRR